MQKTVLPLMLSLAMSCSSLLMMARASAQTGQQETQQRFPDVIGVKVRPAAGGGRQFDFDVTISSPYDTPDRYADGFRVKGKDGTVYGVRKLWHDHAGEQPFTRDLYGVDIPSGVSSVTVEARDQQHGWGGETLDVILPKKR
ncbi:hypothetical protein [Hydrogenophaga sp. 5NK40-0174]|uniref:hypothetical protein n=1 Tax=Hydrogenophaga sp. 5NK40-0174 TaxID=3127649 RepID=UPI0031061CFB